jgi:quercetin dioxygenase-like cupin family protein
MNVIHFNKAKSYEPEKNWKRTSICHEEDISIEHFVKPPKHESPSHKHPSVQILMVLKGKLSIIDEKNNEEILNEGDTVYIPGNEIHIIKNILDEPSIGIDIFVPGRDFNFWLQQK